MRLRLSISTRILLGFLTLLVAFGGVNLWSIYQLRQIGIHLRLLRPVYRLNTRISQLDALQMNQRTDVLRFLQADTRHLQREAITRLLLTPALTSKLEDALQLVQQLAKRIAEQEPDFIQRLDQHFRHLLELVRQRQAILTRSLQHLAQEQRIAIPALRTRFQEIDTLLQQEIRLLSLHMDFRPLQAVLQAEREERRAIFRLVVVSIGILFVGLLIFLWSMIPLRRIRDLAEMTRRISEGDYQQEVKISLGDEIGRLAQDFNLMAQALHERDQHLARQRQALEEAYRDLQRSSEQLLRSERLAAIGRLAAQITHEIRNPLNAIGLNLELLEEDLHHLPDPEEALAVLSSTTHEVERLTAITEEYLHFARLPPPKLEEADLGALLQDVMEFLRNELAARRTAWSWSHAPSRATLLLDQRQIRQALLNLLRNAMEAAKSGPAATPSLQVGLFHADEGIEIHIDDNGEGIAPEAQQKIFDPFFSTKEGGSGLGLPLTQQIIIGHGGTLTYQSLQPHGTRFIITLPR